MYVLVLLLLGDDETLPLINYFPSLCYKVAEKVLCVYLLGPARVPFLDDAPCSSNEIPWIFDSENSSVAY